MTTVVDADTNESGTSRRGRRDLRVYRVWARAQALSEGVRGVEFRRLVQRIMGSPLHECPGTRVLVDGALAFQAITLAIDEAAEEVLLETYILRDDKIGEVIRASLARAVRRGVRVSVLADAVGSLGTSAAYWEQLRADGVQVRLFQRLRYLPFEALRRDHRKLVVVDRCVAMTGGMNIGEEYGSSIRQRSDVWRDTLVRVEGTAATELAAVFAEGWDRAQGPPLPGLEYISWGEPRAPRSPPAPGTVRASRRLREMLKAMVAKRLGQRRDRRRGRRVRRAGEQAAPDSVSAALVLDSRPGSGQREVLATFAALVGGARQRLWLSTPYFAPPTRALTLLGAAVRRGVDVRLLVPSERTDVALVRHAAHGAYAALLRSGVRVFEYQRATLHAKTAVVDGHASVIGSTNLDFRSFWLNAECNVLLFDDRIAQLLEQHFEDDCAQSVEITSSAWEQRTPWHKIGDWLARQLRWAL